MSKYQNVPYDGQGNIADAYWVTIWDKMVEQGLNDVVFCDGSITSAFEFITLMKKCLPTLWIKTEDNTPAALCWLANIDRGIGFSHFVFFKEMWGTGDCLGIAKDMQDFWYNIININLILGVIPAFNTYAINFMSNLGVIFTPPIPHLVNVHGEDSPGVLGYMTKEMFNG